MMRDVKTNCATRKYESITLTILYVYLYDKNCLSVAPNPFVRSDLFFECGCFKFNNTILIRA